MCSQERITAIPISEWPICEACGGAYNPNPQNFGDYHQCGPRDWAIHQARLLGNILKALTDQRGYSASSASRKMP